MNEKNIRLVTAESVRAGHPDKFCDQVADAILDAHLRQDPNARVAVEVFATAGKIIVGGEVTSKAEVDNSRIVAGVINRIGYAMEDLCENPHDLLELEVCLHEQSPDISAAVGKAELGAGDQGIMVGYATNETEEYLPLPVVLAHRICRRLDELKPTTPWLGADGKAQVTVAYENDVPVAVTAVVVSLQHDAEMVSLVEPAHRNEYLDGLAETAEVCRKLWCSTVITQVGAELKNVPREKQHESLAEGLKACVPLLEKNDLTLVFEPLNTKIDHPGYYLTASEEAFQLVDEVGSSRVKVLFDLYHQHITEGLNTERILKNLDKIDHFHVAGYPGRHEPLIHSEIDYPLILRALSEAGFDRTVGLEYFPQEDAANGLSALMQTLNRF